MWVSLCVILIILAQFVTSNQQYSKKLIWIPNDAGLYSHFFQTKYMSGIASNLSRSLVIAPYSDTTHSRENGSIVLCDIFDFKQSQVTCLKHFNASTGPPCQIYYDSILRSANETQCFSGHVYGKSGIVSDSNKLATMNVGPRLTFSSKYINLFEYFHKEYTSSIGGQHYLIVHWRRGDQLSTRCSNSWRGLRDFSVNCASVEGLFAAIKRFKSENSGTGLSVHKLPILIATNEKNETILSALRAKKFVVVHEMLQGFDPLKYRLNASIDEFIVESQFMLNASVMLSFGISQINDVIENERMQRGASFCSYHDHLHSDAKVVHNNWCNLYFKATPQERSQPLPAPVTREEDTRSSGRHPLLSKVKPKATPRPASVSNSNNNNNRGRSGAH